MKLKPLAMAALRLLLLMSCLVSAASPSRAQSTDAGTGDIPSSGAGYVVGTFNIAWPHSTIQFKQTGGGGADAGAWSASGTFTVNLATGRITNSTVTLSPTNPTAEQSSGPINLNDSNDSFAACGIYDGVGVDARRYPTVPQLPLTAGFVGIYDVQQPPVVCGQPQLPPLDQSVSLDYSSLGGGLTGLFLKLDNSKQFDFSGPHAVLAIDLYQFVNQTQDEWDQQPLDPKQGLQAPAPGVWKAAFRFELATGSPGDITLVTSDVANTPAAGGLLSFSGTAIPPQIQCLDLQHVIFQSEPSSSASDSADSGTAVPCLKITFRQPDGTPQVIDGNIPPVPISVFAGQLIDLHVSPQQDLSIQPGTIFWSGANVPIPGADPNAPTAVAGYSETRQESVETPLTNLTSETLDFYWSAADPDGSTPRTVVVTAQLSNGQIGAASVRFQVIGPTVLTLDPTMRGGGGAQDQGPQLPCTPNRFCAPPAPPPTLNCGFKLPLAYCMDLSPWDLASVLTWHNQGQQQWVQVIISNTMSGKTAEGTSYICANGAKGSLVGQFPALDTTGNGVVYTGFPLAPADAPSWPLQGWLADHAISADVDFQARMFLEWEPNLPPSAGLPTSDPAVTMPGAIEVALGSVAWHWQYHASRAKPGQPGSTPDAVWQGPANEAPSKTAMATSEHPKWKFPPTGNVVGCP